MANSTIWPYELVTEEIKFVDSSKRSDNFSSLDFLEATQILLEKVENPAFAFLKWATLLLEFCQPSQLQLVVRFFEPIGSQETTEETHLFFKVNTLNYHGRLVRKPDNCLEISLYCEGAYNSPKLIDEFPIVPGESDFLRLGWLEAKPAQNELRRNIALTISFIKNYLERQRLKQTLGTLQQTEALRMALLDQAEHDLHGPLGSLALATGLLLDKGLDLPANELRLILQRLKRNVFSLNTLLEHYLHAPRLITEGQIPPPNLQAITLSTRLQTLAELIALQLESKEQKLELILSPETESLKVRADEHFLDQILLNLVYNAHKHTPAGTQLRLEVERDEKYLKISVVDNGPGIAPELIAEFEALFQGNILHDNHLGLGLKLVNELTRRQHGVAGFSSSPGATSFWVKLPLAN